MHGKQILRAEAKFDVLQPLEAPNQQTAAGEQRNSDSNFRDNQHRQPAAGCAPDIAALPAISDGRHYIVASGPLQHRDQRTDQRSEQSDQADENQYAAINADVTERPSETNGLYRIQNAEQRNNGISQR